MKKFVVIVVGSILGAILGIGLLVRDYSPVGFFRSKIPNLVPSKVGDAFVVSRVVLSNWDYLTKLIYQKKVSKNKYLWNRIAPEERVKVVVDISEQQAYVKFGEDKVKVYTISTGGPQPERRMNPALWRISSKHDRGLSALYGPRLLFLERYTWNGFMRTTIALHGTNTPEILGRPLSLGCIYFKNSDILEIYDELRVGDYVITVE